MASSTLIAELDQEIARVEAELNTLQSAREMLVKTDEVELVAVSSKNPASQVSLGTVKRGRGRPSKSETEPVKRGRPRKTQTQGNGGGSLRSNIINLLEQDDASVKEIADHLGTSVNYVYNVRRTLSDKPAKQTRTSRTAKRNVRVAEAKQERKAKRNGSNPNKADEIKSLVEQGMTAKEIAEELDCSLNYVYLIKRNM